MFLPLMEVFAKLQGLKDIYKVEFTDETYTNCGLEHLWIVKDKVQFNRKKDWSVLSAKQLIERGFVYKKKEGTKSTFKHNYKFRIINKINRYKWKIY